MLANAVCPTFLADAHLLSVDTNTLSTAIFADSSYPTMLADAAAPTIAAQALSSAMVANADASTIFAQASLPPVLANAASATIFADAFFPSMLASATAPAIYALASYLLVLANAAAAAIFAPALHPSMITLQCWHRLVEIRSSSCGVLAIQHKRRRATSPYTRESHMLCLTWHWQTASQCHAPPTREAASTCHWNGTQALQHNSILA